MIVELEVVSCLYLILHTSVFGHSENLINGTENILEPTLWKSNIALQDKTEVNVIEKCHNHGGVQ